MKRIRSGAIFGSRALGLTIALLMLSVGLVVSVTSCGDEPATGGCDQTSCPAGCCQGNFCSTGLSNQACGTAGRSCSNCAALGGVCDQNLQTCSSSQCMPDCTTKCIGDSDGCNGTCKTGKDCTVEPCTPNCDGKCSGESDGCTGTCNDPADCQPGCTPDCAGKCAGASNGCNGICTTSSCTGCCQGATCLLGTSDTACGKIGSTAKSDGSCWECPSDFEGCAWQCQASTFTCVKDTASCK